MPYRESKTIKGLITHYGKWTKKEEEAFYETFSFKDWRGSHGVIPRHPSSESMGSQQPQEDTSLPQEPS